MLSFRHVAKRIVQWRPRQKELPSEACSYLQSSCGFAQASPQMVCMNDKTETNRLAEAAPGKSFDPVLLVSGFNGKPMIYAAIPPEALCESQRSPEIRVGRLMAGEGVDRTGSSMLY
jgi:hypothetical protein